MNYSKEIKKKATEYFQGNVNLEDEKKLSLFIRENDENYQMFCEWERIWEASHECSVETESAWGRICELLDSNTTIVSLKKRIYAWRIISAASVAIVLVFAAILGLMNLSINDDSYYICTAPIGSKTELQLPDGSKVWLNTGSTLRYSSSFNKNNRDVELIGEAYFEVAKKNGSEFVVKTSDYNVVVKGTKFDVSAYAEDSLVVTELMEGKVEVCRDKSVEQIVPGETIIYDKKSKKMKKGKSQALMNAWVHNYTKYDNILLSDLAKILSRKYAVNIYIDNEDMKQSHFAINLQNDETIDEVLIALEKATGLHAYRKDKDIHLR